MHLLKGGKKQFRKWEITSRSNYEMLMLYTFLKCTICVRLKLNVMKRNLAALLSKCPSYFSFFTIKITQEHKQLNFFCFQVMH